MELVAEIVLTLTSTRKAGCQIEVEVPEGMAMDSYPGALGQVLANLINNAMVHGYEGVREGRIIVRAERAGDDSIVLSVQDFWPRHCARSPQNHIFEPFSPPAWARAAPAWGCTSHNLVSQVLGGVSSSPVKLATEPAFVPRCRCMPQTSPQTPPPLPR